MVIYIFNDPKPWGRQVLEEQVEAELEAERAAAEEEQRAARAAIETKKAELQGLEAARRQAVRRLCCFACVLLKSPLLGLRSTTYQLGLVPLHATC
jgi:hypothetical protein